MKKRKKHNLFAGSHWEKRRFRQLTRQHPYPYPQRPRSNKNEKLRPTKRA